MAQKKKIIHVCDRCGHEQDKPLPGHIKVDAGKKWKDWEFCEGCNDELGDFLANGLDEPHDNDGKIG